MSPLKIDDFIDQHDLGKIENYRKLETTSFATSETILIQGGEILESHEAILYEGDIILHGSEKAKAGVLCTDALFCNKLKIIGPGFIFIDGPLQAAEIQIETESLAMMVSGKINVRLTKISSPTLPKALDSFPSESWGKIEATDTNVQNELRNRQERMAKDAPFLVKISGLRGGSKPGEEDLYGSSGAKSRILQVSEKKKDKRLLFQSSSLNHFKNIYWLNPTLIQCSYLGTQRGLPGEEHLVKIDLANKTFLFEGETTPTPWSEIDFLYDKVIQF